MATPINSTRCLSDCRAARCGDGFVHAGVEACDDGNRRQTDGCLNTCVIARCGDGHVRAGVEACDDGNRVNTDACINACRRARCGDGIVRAGREACDDGNANNLDGCTDRCEVLNPPPNCSFVEGRDPVTVKCETTVSWNAAEAACVAWGGHLATVVDQDDQNRLWSAAERRSHWIGLYKNEQDAWVWSGRASGFRRWANWQPDDTGGREDCTEIWSVASGRWNDAPCSALRRSFCER